MFTGIIEGIGNIKSIKDDLFEIEYNKESSFFMGESIALNGLCATLIEQKNSSLFFNIMKISQETSHFGKAQIGDKINIERSAKIGNRNSGHHVTGHIDQVGTIQNIKKMKNSYLIEIDIHPENRKYLVPKGSIAVEGISLTIAHLQETLFQVAIIPYTWQNTNLSSKQIGDLVNLEFDIFGKYVLNR